MNLYLIILKQTLTLKGLTARPAFASHKTPSKIPKMESANFLCAWLFVLGNPI